MRVCLALGIRVPRQLRAAASVIGLFVGRVAETWFVRWHVTASYLSIDSSRSPDSECSRSRSGTQYGFRENGARRNLGDEVPTSRRFLQSGRVHRCQMGALVNALVAHNSGDESSVDYCLALISEEGLRGLARGRDAVVPAAGPLRWSLRAARAMA